MTANQKTQKLVDRLTRAGINLDFDSVNTLRRAEMTLHRWSEMECGDSNDYGSWGIERDEKTGKPYMVTTFHNDTPPRPRRRLIADREAGALRRIAKICADAGLIYYHQTDPRGCSLYIGRADMLGGTDIASNYTRLIAIC